MGIQFNKTPLVVEQNNYTTKIVNVYIVYDLDNCSKNPLRNFTLINFKIIKKSMRIVAKE